MRVVILTLLMAIGLGAAAPNAEAQRTWHFCAADPAYLGGNDCNVTTGTADSPGRYMNLRNHCPEPGDRVLFCEADSPVQYNSSHFRAGFVDLRGLPGLPITIGAYDHTTGLESTGNCAVWLEGSFYNYPILDYDTDRGSRYLRYKNNVCPRNPSVNSEVMQVESDGIEIYSAEVTFFPGRYTPTTSAAPYDCIKISNNTDVGAPALRDTLVIGVDISECGEDGIDVGASHGLTVAGVTVNQVFNNQIKLGAGFFSYYDVDYTDIWLGLVGRGGNHYHLSRFAAADWLLDRAVPDRAMASYGAFKRITMDGVGGGNAFSPSGWQHIHASNITVVNGGSDGGGATITFSGSNVMGYPVAGDPIVDAYCNGVGSSFCTATTQADSSAAWDVRTLSDDITLVDSSFEGYAFPFIVGNTNGQAVSMPCIDQSGFGTDCLCTKNLTLTADPGPIQFAAYGSSVANFAALNTAVCP